MGIWFSTVAPWQGRDPMIHRVSSSCAVLKWFPPTFQDSWRLPWGKRESWNLKGGREEGFSLFECPVLDLVHTDVTTQSTTGFCPVLFHSKKSNLLPKMLAKKHLTWCSTLLKWRLFCADLCFVLHVLEVGKQRSSTKEVAQPSQHKEASFYNHCTRVHYCCMKGCSTLKGSLNVEDTHICNEGGLQGMLVLLRSQPFTKRHKVGEVPEPAPCFVK